MSAIDTWSRHVLSEMDAQLKVAALGFKDIIGRTLSIPGTGRFYKRRKGAGFKNVTVKSQGPLQRGEKRLAFKVKQRNLTKFHHASAPGNPPARDLGALFRSRYAEQSGPHQYSVGVATKYAKPLEFGTTRIKPRRFMAPSAEVFKKVFGSFFQLSK